MSIPSKRSKQTMMAGFLSFALISQASAFVSIPTGVYAGLFGGAGATSNNHINQSGTAFFSAANGGPLAVNANGNSDSNATGILGMHFGYEAQHALFGNSDRTWNLVPAAELEGYYLRVRQTTQLTNPTARVPEHTFDDSFPMNTGVILANSVWVLKMPSMTIVNPYVGVGIGTATISISDANSKQVHPYEVGVNHFNSNTSASDWTFAAQAKVGLRFNINAHWRAFAEYRYLYLAASNYTFGSTQYPTHVPTTNWSTHIGSTNFNIGAAGIEYTF